MIIEFGLDPSMARKHLVSFFQNIFVFDWTRNKYDFEFSSLYNTYSTFPNSVSFFDAIL